MPYMIRMPFSLIKFSRGSVCQSHSKTSEENRKKFYFTRRHICFCTYFGCDLYSMHFFLFVSPNTKKYILKYGCLIDSTLLTLLTLEL